MYPKLEINAANNMFISSKEIFLGILVALIWWPIGFLLYLINRVLRCLIQGAYASLYPSGRYIMTEGSDGVFGYKVKGNCNSLIAGFQIIQGTPRLGAIRSKFNTLFNDSKDYARFKYIFSSKLGYFCWERDESFDIRRHIRLYEGTPHGEPVDELKVLDIISKLVTCPMRKDRPQWETLLVPNYYMEDERGIPSKERHYVLITRFNHAYSDAISYFLMINNYIADAKSSLPLDPTRPPFKLSLFMKLIVWGKVAFLGPYYFVSIMATFLFDKSVFGVASYDEEKICSRSSPIKLEVVKKLKKASGASVTAILYTALYSALYKNHQRLHPKKPVPSHLHLGSVAAMFPYLPKLGNQFTIWPYTAPLPGTSLKERLAWSNEICVKGAGGPGPVFNFHLSRALGSLPKMLHPLLWQLSGCPVMLSNVPGFTSKLRIHGGEMVDSAGFLPLMTTVGIGVSTQTYCGDLRFNCVVDPQVFNRKDLQIFLEDIIQELSELAKIYEVNNYDYKHFSRVDRNEHIFKMDGNEDLIKLGKCI